MELPVITPATEAKTYDEWFYGQFSCENLHDDTLATLSFVRIPRSSLTKELLHSHAEIITRPFWPLVSPGSPEFNQDAASAMQAVLAVLPSLANTEP